MNLQLIDGIVIVFAPYKVIVMWRIDSIIAEDSNTQFIGDMDNIVMQFLGKGVSGINHQAYIMFTAKGDHVRRRH